MSAAATAWAPLRRELVACKGKRRYDEAQARAVAAWMTLRERTQLTPYRCSFCRSWHIGRPDKAQNKSAQVTENT